MFQGIKFIFWDNDGILVDTEKLYFEATRRIFKKIGFDFTRELYIENILMHSRGAWHLLDAQEYSPEYLNQLRSDRDTLYEELVKTEEILIDGVEEVLSKLSEKYRMAVVTSSKTHHFKAVHSRTNLLKYFDFIITPEDYIQYKPHPEPYLVAMKKMGANCEESIAIEDSQRGLMSAKSAGMKCIIIPNDLTRTSDFSIADDIIPKVNDLLKIL